MLILLALMNAVVLTSYLPEELCDVERIMEDIDDKTSSVVMATVACCVRISKEELASL